MQPSIREIPLNKLIASDANVRKTKPLSGVEELAANIAAKRGRIVQSLSVRPVRNDAGEETGFYRVPAGGRRLAALQLLAKRKVIAKTAPVPCIVNEEDDETDVSLSENAMREPLHPADQFDAFKLLADRGDGLEAIGARYGVTAQVVRQRLRLAAVSPNLLQAYRDEGLTLDQLMAFAVTEDHARQEQVYAALGVHRPPYMIRRMLTEAQVPANDRRAIFVGAEAYVEAGGAITRDLFTDDQGGWFNDPGLLDRLALEKLVALAGDLRERDGWKWAVASMDYPNAQSLTRIYPKHRDLAVEEQARVDELSTRYDALAGEWDAADELPEDVSDELDRLTAELNALSASRYQFDPEVIGRAGAFVILGNDGAARIEVGFIRPEDQPQPEPDEGALPQESNSDGDGAGSEEAAIEVDKPLSDALVRELTAHRTMALRVTLGDHPDIALVAVVHALALRIFYPSAWGTCLDLVPTCAGLGNHAPGIEDTAAARTVAERHASWASRVPERVVELWAFVAGLEPGERLALLAHCASLTVFAVREAWDRSGRYVAASATLAEETSLDMTTFWQPTATSYFARVTKTKIVDAVREAVSAEAASRIEGSAKAAMAEAAEALVAGTTWLPFPLRSGGSLTEGG